MRLASSCTVMASGMTTSRLSLGAACWLRPIFLSRRRRMAASDGPLSRSPSTPALVTVRRPRALASSPRRAGRSGAAREARRAFSSSASLTIGRTVRCAGADLAAIGFAGRRRRHIADRRHAGASRTRTLAGGTAGGAGWTRRSARTQGCAGAALAFGTGIGIGTFAGRTGRTRRLAGTAGNHAHAGRTGIALRSGNERRSGSRRSGRGGRLCLGLGRLRGRGRLCGWRGRRCGDNGWRFGLGWSLGGAAALFFKARGFLADLPAARIFLDAAGFLGGKAGLVLGGAGAGFAQARRGALRPRRPTGPSAGRCCWTGRVWGGRWLCCGAPPAAAAADAVARRSVRPGWARGGCAFRRRRCATARATCRGGCRGPAHPSMSASSCQRLRCRPCACRRYQPCISRLLSMSSGKTSPSTASRPVSS